MKNLIQRGRHTHTHTYINVFIPWSLKKLTEAMEHMMFISEERSELKTINKK